MKYLLLISLVLGISASPNLDYAALFRQNPGYVSDGFDFPMVPPNAKSYYNAQGFGKNDHLGDDWNGVGGGNSDLGDPIFSICNGYVVSCEHNGSGWGNVIRVVHRLKPEKFIESLYAHCETMEVKPGEWVKRGQRIATIGNADGTYWAHLHLELRTTVDMGLGGGYSDETTGFADPSAFIRSHRPD